MLTDEDKKILEQKGITEEELENQLKQFQTGFPYMKVEKPAVVPEGIKCIDDKSKNDYLTEWQEYLKNNHSVVK